MQNKASLQVDLHMCNCMPVGYGFILNPNEYCMYEIWGGLMDEV